MIVRSVVTFSLLCLAAMSSARAAIVYDRLTGSNPLAGGELVGDISTSTNVAIATRDAFRKLAQPFQTGANPEGYRLDDVTFRANYLITNSPGVSAVDVQLSLWSVANQGGFLRVPQSQIAVLDTINVPITQGTTPPSSATYPNLDLAFDTGKYFVSANTSYAFVLEILPPAGYTADMGQKVEATIKGRSGAGSTSPAGWISNSFVYRTDSGSFTSPSVSPAGNNPLLFRINATQVPEPTSLAGAALLVVGLATLARRR